MNIIGFTGTRQGMSLYQLDELRYLLERIEWSEFHHGNCLGADEEASFIARDVVSTCGGLVTVIAHPCDLKHAQSQTAYSYQKLEALAPLERNDAIVAACDILIAAPLGEEIQRSGTWYTIRRAREAHKIVHILERTI